MAVQADVMGDSAQRHGERRQQDQHDDHHQIFDDQPADGDMTFRRGERVALLHGPQQDDRTGDGERQSQHQSGTGRPAPEISHGTPQQRRRDDLHDGAGHGDPAHRQQIVEREMQAHSEHQQDHADLRQLLGQTQIGDEAGSEGADGDARQEITDDGRQMEPHGDEPAQQGEAQPGGDGGDQCDVMRQASDLSGDAPL